MNHPNLIVAFVALSLNESSDPFRAAQIDEIAECLSDAELEEANERIINSNALGGAR